MNNLTGNVVIDQTSLSQKLKSNGEVGSGSYGVIHRLNPLEPLRGWARPSCRSIFHINAEMGGPTVKGGSPDRFVETKDAP
jgi:hypothetical protein